MKNFNEIFKGLEDLKHRSPIYDSFSDYNTNSKSYYDYLARFNYLMKILVERVAYYDEELSKRFEEWDKLIEKFPENVENLLIQWLNDGTLETIINENIFNDLNNKIDKIKKDLENEINIINSKLKHFIVNIEEFEGSDTKRIQAALDKVASYGGGVVYVPKHKYQLDESLKISKNTILFSEPGTYYERTTSDYMIINGKKGDNFNRYEGNGNIQIINGIFDGKAQNNFEGKGSNFLFAHADNVLIINVELRNSNSHHIEINSSINVKIKDCKILGQLSSLTAVESIQLDLSTENSYSGFGLFDNTPCKNVTIENCLFDKSNECPSVSRGFGSHNQRIGGYMENIKVLNNVFISCRDFAVNLKGYKNTTIEGNQLKDCVGGMIFYANDENTQDIYNEVTSESNPIKDLFIKNNIFDNITSKQMCYSYGREKSRNENIIIQDNIFKNSQKTNGGVLINYTDNAKIINNQFIKVDAFNVILKNIKFIIISENRFIDSGGSTAFRAYDGCQNIIFSNNNLTNIGGNGVNILENFLNVIVSGNIIQGCNTIDSNMDAIYMHSTGKNVNITNNLLLNSKDGTFESGIYCAQNVTGVRSGNISDKGNNDEKYRAVTIIDKGDI